MTNLNNHGKVRLLTTSLLYGESQLVMTETLPANRVLRLSLNEIGINKDLSSLFTLIQAEKEIDIIMEGITNEEEEETSPEYWEPAIMELKLDNLENPITNVVELLANPIEIHDFKLHILPFDNDIKVKNYVTELIIKGININSGFTIEDYAAQLENVPKLKDLEYIKTSKWGKSYIENLKISKIPQILKIYLEHKSDFTKIK